MFPKVWQAWPWQCGPVLQDYFPMSSEEAAFADFRQRKLIVHPFFVVLTICTQTKKIKRSNDALSSQRESGKSSQMNGDPML